MLAVKYASVTNVHELVSRDSLETPKSRAQSRRLGCLVRAAAPGKQFYSTPETNTVKPSDILNNNKFSQALKLSDIAGKGRRAGPLSRRPGPRGPSDGSSPFKVDRAGKGESDIESILGIPSRKLERPTLAPGRAGRSLAH